MNCLCRVTRVKTIHVLAVLDWSDVLTYKGPAKSTPVVWKDLDSQKRTSGRGGADTPSGCSLIPSTDNKTTKYLLHNLSPVQPSWWIATLKVSPSLYCAKYACEHPRPEVLSGDVPCSTVSGSELKGAMTSETFCLHISTSLVRLEKGQTALPGGKVSVLSHMSLHILNPSQPCLVHLFC